MTWTPIHDALSRLEANAQGEAQYEHPSISDNQGEPVPEITGTALVPSKEQLPAALEIKPAISNFDCYEAKGKEQAAAALHIKQATRAAVAAASRHREHVHLLNCQHVRYFHVY